MCYLTAHSTHVIYGYIASDVLKDHSASERGNSFPPLNGGSFISTIPQKG